MAKGKKESPVIGQNSSSYHSAGKAKHKGLRNQRNVEAADEENNAAFWEAVKGFKRRKDIGVVAIDIIFRLHLEAVMPWSRLLLCYVIKELSKSSFSISLLSSTNYN